VGRRTEPFAARRPYPVLMDAQFFPTAADLRAWLEQHEQPEAVRFTAEQTALIQANPAAWEWFSGQSPAYRRSATHGVITAKRPETRTRRLAQLIMDSAGGRKVPPLIPR
jgi:hypothetical protein